MYCSAYGVRLGAQRTTLLETQAILSLLVVLLIYNRVSAELLITLSHMVIVHTPYS